MIVVGRHVFFRAVLRWGAALAFCYPLKHRERFWLRAVELLLSLMALTWLLDPMAQSNSLVQLQISLLGMYVGFFILLGAMIYACALPYADELWITEIEQTYEGDTWFPAFDKEAFLVVSKEQKEGCIVIHYRKR